MRRYILGILLATVAGVPALAAGSDEAAFLAENNAAMTKMMAAMEIKPSGDVDKDFVAMMTPHHQGAVDMAQAMLRYGRTALGQPASVPSPSAGQSPSGHSMHMQREP